MKMEDKCEHCKSDIYQFIIQLTGVPGMVGNGVAMIFTNTKP